MARARPSRPSRAADDRLHRFLERRIAEGRVPGAAWWVGPARGDRPSSRGFVGSAALEPVPEPLRADTPFDLASLTKPLATGFLLALAEQEGRVDLGRSLDRYLPESASLPLGRLTLDAIARHASGLPAWRPLYVEACTAEEYLAAIARQPLERSTPVVYSDLGYILLGFVLERVEGCRLDESFERRIAGPLGLTRTGFAAGGRDFADAAATERGNAYERSLAGAAGAGHRWRSEIPRGEVHDANAHGLGGVAGHAGLFGPVDEVAEIAREVLSPRRTGLGPRARRRLLDTSPAGRSVGWAAASSSSAARGILTDTAPGHVGFTGTSVWLEPATESVMVLLTNRVHPSVPQAGLVGMRRAFHRLALRVAPQKTA